MDYNQTLKTFYEINRTSKTFYEILEEWTTTEHRKPYIRYQKHSNNIGIIGHQNITKLDSQHHREQTCFLPRTPRCGVAKVIKLTGSSPAIIPCLEGAEVWKFPSEDSVTLLEWVPLDSLSEYRTATAYLANKPPREWAKNEIRFRLSLFFTTWRTY